MQFNIIFKTIFEYIHKKFRFVHTHTFCKYRKKYAHRLACILFNDNRISVTSDSVIVGIDTLFSMSLTYYMGLEVLAILLAKLGSILTK